MDDISGMMLDSRRKDSVEFRFETSTSGTGDGVGKMIPRSGSSSPSSTDCVETLVSTRLEVTGCSSFEISSFDDTVSDAEDENVGATADRKRLRFCKTETYFCMRDGDKRA